MTRWPCDPACGPGVHRWGEECGPQALTSQRPLPRGKGDGSSVPLTWPAWTVDRPLGSSPRHPGLRGPQWTRDRNKAQESSSLIEAGSESHCGPCTPGQGRERGQGPASKAWTQGRASGRTCRGKGVEEGPLQQVREQPFRVRPPRRGGQRAEPRSAAEPGRFPSPVRGPDSMVLDAREPQPMRKAQLSSALGGEQL